MSVNYRYRCEKYYLSEPTDPLCVDGQTTLMWDWDPYRTILDYSKSLDWWRCPVRRCPTQMFGKKGHSAPAHLSILKKAGAEITSERVDGVRRYMIQST